MSNTTKELLIMLAMVAFFWVVLLLLFSGCTPRASALLLKGEIIDTDHNRILVLFPDVADKPYSYGYSWFYYPGADTLSAGSYVQVVVKKRRDDGSGTDH